MIFSRKKKELEDYRQKVILYKKVFGSPDGKTVLYDLMNAGYVLNNHKGDPFLEGRRSLVLDILHKCNVSEKELSDMLKGDE